MTKEAVMQKLMFALGKANCEGLTGDSRLRRIREIIQTPIKGDISPIKSD